MKVIDEIHDLVDKYGQAALRCKKAGFDLVEVHGAGGCLPTNFLSPNDNQRFPEIQKYYETYS